MAICRAISATWRAEGLCGSRRDLRANAPVPSCSQPMRGVWRWSSTSTFWPRSSRGQNMAHRAGRYLFGAAVLALGFGWLSLGSTWAKPLPAGSALHASALEVKPVAVEERSRIGDTKARPDRSFYLVVLRLQNRSDKNPFDFEAH